MLVKPTLAVLSLSCMLAPVGSRATNIPDDPQLDNGQCFWEAMTAISTTVLGAAACTSSTGGAAASLGTGSFAAIVVCGAAAHISSQEVLDAWSVCYGPHPGDPIQPEGFDPVGLNWCSANLSFGPSGSGSIFACVTMPDDLGGGQWCETHTWVSYEARVEASPCMD